MLTSAPQEIPKQPLRDGIDLVVVLWGTAVSGVSDMAARYKGTKEQGNKGI